ncbi:oligosaccharide flippase family protein [Clavibacter sp. VKM Ac-2872]|uniref:oligosaccharide flippase family protein n=1 Tax=Clavibacter sp. VKM Ac-2872 TaxID=2783812 RepID=UPI00188C0A26|nr:oligosaccharide flippase family protein [Clavibacter sp. VKM Ac-2872]
MTASAPASAGGLGRQATFLAASTAGAQILTALIYLFAARVSGPTDFGQVVTAIAIATSAVGVLDFGTNSLWIRETAKGALTTHDLARRALAKIVIALVVFSVGAVVLYLVSPNPWLWTAGPIGLFLLISQTAQVPLRAHSRIGVVALSLVTDRVVGMLVLFAGMLMGADGAASLWLALVCGSIGSTLLLLSQMPGRKRLLVTPELRRLPWRGSGFYGLSSMAATSQVLDVAIMSAVAGPAAAGIYGAVNRWTQPMGLAVSAFAAAAVPVVARAQSWSAAWPQVKRALWLPGAALAACVVVIIGAPTFVDILVGDAYAESATVLRVLAFGTLFAIVNQPVAVFLQSLGRDREVSFVTLGLVALQLALVAVLASVYGSVGAAFAFLVAQAVMLLLLLSLTRTGRRGRR